MKKNNDVFIVYDGSNPLTIAYIKELKFRFEEAKIYVELNPLYSHCVDLIVVLGGDGFMSKTIQEYHKFDKPFLGINFGTKRGFLLNDLKPNLVDLIARGKYNIYEFPFLAARSYLANESGYREDMSPNDISVERSTSQCAKFNIGISGVNFGREIMSDGLVVGTALGSSAYNLSAGGSAVHPLLPIICVKTLYELWPPKIPPLVLPWDVQIEVDVLEPKKRKVRVTSGELFTRENVVRTIIGKSNDEFSLVLLEGEDFLRTISKKILRVQGAEEWR